MSYVIVAGLVCLYIWFGYLSYKEHTKLFSKTWEINKVVHASIVTFVYSLCGCFISVLIYLILTL